MRRLEDLTNTTSSDPYEEINDSYRLKTTCILYGSIFAILFPLHCLVRRRFPGVYNIRGWLPRLHCKLAENQYGFISWTWRLMMIPEEEFLEQCGMDALCLVRSLYQGLKLSLLGVFLSTWLLPIYATAPESNETENIDDKVVELTIANVPDGSNRFIATVIASYLLFAFAAYLILQEFSWFTDTRTKVLARREPRNYTVYVSNIPQQLRSNEALSEYFRQIFSDEAVLEAHVTLVIPNLEQKVERRQIVIEKLEHAFAQEEITGVAPTHRAEIGGDKVDSIETYQLELEVLNREISEEITSLDEAAKALPNDSSVEKQDESPCVLTSVLVGSYKDAVGEEPSDDASIQESKSAQTSAVDSLAKDDVLESSRSHIDDEASRSVSQAARSSSLTNSSSSDKNEGDRDSSRNKGVKLVTDVSKDVVITTMRVAGIASFGRGDGAPLPAGFVTFTKLSTVAASLQMVQTRKPYEMDVSDAPTPEGIVWGNVGRGHKSVSLGRFLSFAFSVVLCLFWSIPVTFILSISSVESLKETFDWLNDWIEKAPWLEVLLQQLAPLLLWLLGEVLYIIMDIIVKWEGHTGVSYLEASLFTKLSSFNIVQNFFVASIAGSVTSALQHLIDDPGGIVQYLAYTLPPQSTFFIQFMLAQTVLGLGFETLRVTQVWQERLRKLIGPNLTEKERNKKFTFLRPLGDPRNFFHARIFADTILFFMLTFVYTILSPIICFFLCFCYLAKIIAYRHQLVYIYPPTPDSGGRLWMSSIYFIVSCMLIAELTIGGYLVLKQAPVAAPLMIPLFILTCMFLHYIRQRHFRVAYYLSSDDCMHYDLIHTEEGMDFDFVRGKYRQPAMQNKVLFPDHPRATGSSSQNEESRQRVTMSEESSN